jgi:hypothetical protein
LIESYDILSTDVPRDRAERFRPSLYELVSEQAPEDILENEYHLSQMKNPPTPLTPRERDTLDRLEQWVDSRDDPKERNAIIEQITTEDINSATAQRLLNRLLSKGYLYELDDGIRVTDPGSRD